MEGLMRPDRLRAREESACRNRGNWRQAGAPGRFRPGEVRRDSIRVFARTYPSELSGNAGLSLDAWLVSGVRVRVKAFSTPIVHFWEDH
jgi:hypothetical protein